ncbi:MAG: hypothetical protein ACREVN_04750 [Gammaproteobacteria bacterium]
MNAFEFVLILVFIITVASLIKHRDRQRAHSRKATPETDANLRRIDDLEHRIQVLERIVTDRNFDLKRQFEDLERG